MEAVRRASQGLMAARTSSSSSRSPDSSDPVVATVPAANAEDSQDIEEVEPLIPRNTQNLDPQEFRDARTEAIQQAAMEAGWFTHIIVFFAFCAFGFWFYVNIRSWYVLLMYWDSPCDQPLSQWLLVKLLLDVVSSGAQQRQRTRDRGNRVTWINLVLVNAWLVFGFQWCADCKTCQATSPELYHWVNFLVIFGTVMTVILMLLPVLFYMGVILVAHLIGTGRIRNRRAARDDTLELLETVTYRPDIFADSSNRGDDRPAGECCCCVEDFNADKVIVRTPCRHFFHQDCLGEWLKLAKTCPMCRCDLEVATEALSSDKEVVASRTLDLEEPSSSSGAHASSSAAQSSTAAATEGRLL